MTSNTMTADDLLSQYPAYFGAIEMEIYLTGKTGFPHGTPWKESLPVIDGIPHLRDQNPDFLVNQTLECPYPENAWRAWHRTYFFQRHLQHKEAPPCAACVVTQGTLRESVYYGLSGTVSQNEYVRMFFNTWIRNQPWSIGDFNDLDLSS